MVVIDTHVLLWSQMVPEMLSKNASKSIEDAKVIIVASITLWEIAMLEHKNRIRLPIPLVDWLKEVCRQPKVRLQEITPDIAALSCALDIHGDPADRLIIATAQLLALPLISADWQIRSSSSAQTIW